MKTIDVIKYILDTYERDEDIETCLLIDENITKLDYYVGKTCNGIKVMKVKASIVKESDEFYKNL